MQDGGTRDAPTYPPTTPQQHPLQSLQPPAGHKLLAWVKRRGSQRRSRGRGPAVGGNGVREKMQMLIVTSGHKMIDIKH